MIFPRSSPPLSKLPANVLESGIDIVARPPGKQLQTISLLSGGEQTMTAVALLFSIYQVKPSPFCVLDELDAPLDESNINRFIRVLQRFLEHSQFIIITQNKRTIGTGDAEEDRSLKFEVRRKAESQAASARLPPSLGCFGGTGRRGRNPKEIGRLKFENWSLWSVVSSL